MKDKIENLIKQWRKDMKTYPPTENGLLAQAVLKLCAKELEEVIN